MMSQSRYHSRATCPRLNPVLAGDCTNTAHIDLARRLETARSAADLDAAEREYQRSQGAQLRSLLR